MLSGIRQWLKGASARDKTPEDSAARDEFGIIRDPSRIHNLLSDLRRNRVMLTVRIDDIRHTFVSSVIAIDADTGTLVLDELNPSAGHDLLSRRKSFWVEGLLNSVPVSFQVLDYKVDSQDGIACYRLPIPSHVRYPQRRAGKRLPMRGPVQVPLQVRDQNGNDLMTGDLANISLGGIAAWIRGASPAVGDDLESCRMRFPDGTLVDFALGVRYSQAFPKENKTLIGGYFSVLPDSELKKVERFILSLERSQLREHAGTGPVKRR